MAKAAKAAQTGSNSFSGAAVPDAIARLEAGMTPEMRAVLGDEPLEVQAAPSPTTPEPSASPSPDSETPPSPEPTRGVFNDTESALPPGTEPHAQRQPDDEAIQKLSHKVSVLEGITKKQGVELTELPKLREENAALKTALSQAQAELSRTQTSKEEAAFEHKLREQFGDESAEPLLAAIKANRTASEAKIASIIDEVRQNAANVIGFQAKQIEAGYYTTLKTAVPDYATICNEPGFATWLNQESPEDGELRMDKLVRADGNRNANAVAKIYKAYVTSKGEATPPKKDNKPNPAILSQMSTRGDRATNTPAPSGQQRPMTETDIIRLGKQVARGNGSMADIEALFGKAAH